MLRFASICVRSRLHQGTWLIAHLSSGSSTETLSRHEVQNPEFSHHSKDQHWLSHYAVVVENERFTQKWTPQPRCPVVRTDTRVELYLRCCERCETHNLLMSMFQNNHHHKHQTARNKKKITGIFLFLLSWGENQEHSNINNTASNLSCQNKLKILSSRATSIPLAGFMLIPSSL